MEALMYKCLYDTVHSVLQVNTQECYIWSHSRSTFDIYLFFSFFEISLLISIVTKLLYIPSSKSVSVPFYPHQYLLLFVWRKIVDYRKVESSTYLPSIYHVCTCMLWYVRVRQRTCRSLLSMSTVWVLEIEFRASSLVAGAFTLWIPYGFNVHFSDSCWATAR